MSNLPKKPGSVPAPPGQRPGVMRPGALPPLPKPGAKPGAKPAAQGQPATAIQAWKRLARKHPRLVGSAGAAVVLLLAFAILHHPVTACTNTPQRKRAMLAVVNSKDPVTGATLDGRFDPDDLICRETDEPAGVLIAAQEKSGEPVVWFIDANGAGHNVNLLAQAFTPAFKPAAVLPPEAAQALLVRGTPKD